MTRKICWLLVALVAQIVMGAAAQEGTDILDAITASSEALTSYSATIQMTRHETVSYTHLTLPTKRIV